MYYLDISKNYLKGLSAGTLSPLSKLTQLAVYGNCLDDDLLAEQERAFIQSKISQWKNNQQLCIGEVIYDPATSTTENVTAQVVLYGNSAKRADVLQKAEKMFVHVFQENGKHVFDYSEYVNEQIVNLSEINSREAEVNWIDKDGS
jgi:hypothetical protein